MPTLYVETTIPSYLVAKPSRDIVVLAHQQLTREWWDKSRHLYDMFISQVVLDEIREGDPEMIDKRMEILQGIPLLETNDEVESLAERYFVGLQLPPKALRDAFHLAYVVAYRIDFLITWNCAHLANANILYRLSRVNRNLGYETPMIYTPEELIEYPKEN
ncbi:MAG: type II toxin-antitoxin system VapC family toxin [Candidatus Edwardsbacteria bacterium]